MLVFLLAAALAAGPQSPTVSLDPEEQLAAAGLLKAGDRAQLARGGIVTKMLDVPNKSEIRTLVVLRVAATESQFRACMHDPLCLKRPGDLVGAGTLPPPAAAGAFAEVHLDKKEL